MKINLAALPLLFLLPVLLVDSCQRQEQRQLNSYIAGTTSHEVDQICAITKKLGHPCR